MDQQYFCNIKNDQSEILDKIAIDDVALYSFLIIGPIAFLGCLINMIIYFKYKKLRKEPGNIILMIAFAQLFEVTHWISMAAMQTYKG